MTIDSLEFLAIFFGTFVITAIIGTILQKRNNSKNTIRPKDRHVLFSQVNIAREVKETRPWIFLLPFGILLIIAAALTGRGLVGSYIQLSNTVRILLALCGAAITGFSVFNKEIKKVQKLVYQGTKSYLSGSERVSKDLDLSSPVAVISSVNSILDEFRNCCEGLTVAHFFLLGFNGMFAEISNFAQRLLSRFSHTLSVLVLLLPIDNTLITNARNSNALAGILSTLKDGISSILIVELERLLGSEAEMKKRFDAMVSFPLDILAKTLLLYEIPNLEGKFIVPCYGCSENVRDSLLKALSNPLGSFSSQLVTEVLIITALSGNGNSHFVKAEAEKFGEELKERVPSARVSVFDPVLLETQAQASVVHSCVFFLLDKYPKLEEWSSAIGGGER